MKNLALFAILVLMLSSVSACIIRTGPRHGSRHSHARSCPPSYHWNGAACVHNSNRGRGHGKGKHRR